jgi:FlaA1/EpsC-like NDP-sugar epimerase
MLLPERYLSKGYVFLIDLILTFISLIMAYLIRFDFIDFYELFWIKEYESIVWGIPILLSVRALSYLLTKTHMGVIRHLSSADVEKIFLSISYGTIIITIISFCRYYFFDGISLLPKSVIIIEYLGTLFLLLAIRFLVKIIYLEKNKVKGNKERVLIYGAGKMGIITKNTLERDAKNKFKVCGFIDDSLKRDGMMIERVMIIHPKNLIKQIEKLKIETVIIAIKDPEIDNKRNLINLCLEKEINISTVPSLDQWINGDFNTKQIQKIKIDDLLGRKAIELEKKHIKNQVENKCILITGAAGSIGSEISRQLIQYNAKKVILLDQAESPIYELNQELLSKHKNINWEIVIGDITRQDRMENVFKFFKPNLVFHAAAYKHVPLMELNPAEAIRTNVRGTKILATLADKHNVDKFVFISTDKAVNPTNVMGASKRISEMFCQSLNKSSKTNFITTRFGNVLGSNGSVIPLFKKQIEKGGPITVTHENVTRYFMTIPEACQLVLEACVMGNGGEIFVFDMGKSVKIIDLAKKMIKLSGLEIDSDIKIKVTGLRPGEKMYEELLSDQENTMATHHPKILIGKVMEVEFKAIQSLVEKLISYSEIQDNDLIVKQMKDIVPEFLSNNSDFSKFDTIK